VRHALKVIEVVDYDPGWPETFERLRALYETALEAVPVVAIEHIGSTAVEDLAAKPIIDIDIVVAPDHVRAATRALGTIGLMPLGEQGIPGRWAFEAPDDLPRTHTYAVEAGGLALRNHLAIRDALRHDPALRSEYAGLKRALARTSQTSDAYLSGKSEFLLGVLEEAGLSLDDLAAIVEANDEG
jgi:GrpB-like predicted nucleotidyltransferase (UPF0157 family)